MGSKQAGRDENPRRGGGNVEFGNDKSNEFEMSFLKAGIFQMYPCF